MILEVYELWEGSNKSIPNTWTQGRRCHRCRYGYLYRPTGAI